MSELQPVSDGAAESQEQLPGTLLRQAREDRGWSVAEVAGKLHLTESAIVNLEADRYDELPGVTFVRGYIRSYAWTPACWRDCIPRQARPSRYEPCLTWDVR